MSRIQIKINKEKFNIYKIYSIKNKITTTDLITRSVDIFILNQKNEKLLKKRLRDFLRKEKLKETRKHNKEELHNHYFFKNWTKRFYMIGNTMLHNQGEIDKEILDNLMKMAKAEFKCFSPKLKNIMKKQKLQFEKLGQPVYLRDQIYIIKRLERSENTKQKELK